MARRNPKRKPGFTHNHECDRPFDYKPQALRTPLPSNSPRIASLLESIKLGVLSTASLAKLYNTSSSQVRRLRTHGLPFVASITKKWS